jgi:hypothetical protein
VFTACTPSRRHWGKLGYVNRVIDNSTVISTKHFPNRNLGQDHFTNMPDRYQTGIGLSALGLVLRALTSWRISIIIRSLNIFSDDNVLLHPLLWSLSVLCWKFFDHCLSKDGSLLCFADKERENSVIAFGRPKDPRFVWVPSSKNFYSMCVKRIYICKRYAK